MFWILAVLLTLLAAVPLLTPLLRAFVPLPSRAGYDVEVYGAQMRELQGDLRRGLLPAGEAASARAEIGRRLLRAAGERDSAHAAARDGVRGRMASVAAVLLVVALFAAAFPVYLRLGQPNQPDQPLSARAVADPAEGDIRTLVAEAEARLRQNPNDGTGWEALLPVYLRMGRGADAVKAADNAIRILGSTADRLAMKGQAEVQAASGRVTNGAERTFRAALALDPANGPARFYLALGLTQQGLFAEAVPAWQLILDRGPADAPWMAAARQALAEAREKAGLAPPAAVEPGPTAGDVAAAAVLSPAERTAMVQGMVSQLAERLKSAPNDPEGWKRLMRSYAALGDDGRAREAYAAARAAFADGSPERRSVDDFATGLGLGDGKAVP